MDQADVNPISGDGSDQFCACPAVTIDPRVRILKCQMEFPRDFGMEEFKQQEMQSGKVNILKRLIF